MRRPSVLSERCETSRELGDRSVRAMRFWHNALILGAVLSLTIHVASRYCYVTGAETQTLNAAKAHSPDAKRQHLLNDGLHWSAPAAFVLFKPTGVFAALLPAVPSITRLYSEDCRYSRPPPSC